MTNIPEHLQLLRAQTAQSFRMRKVGKKMAWRPDPELEKDLIKAESDFTDYLFNQRKATTT